MWLNTLTSASAICAAHLVLLYASNATYLQTVPIIAGEMQVSHYSYHLLKTGEEVDRSKTWPMPAKM
jgi:hypothetical protein